MKPVCSALSAGPGAWLAEREAILCRDPQELISGHRFDIVFQTVGTGGGIRPRQDV